MDRIQELLSRLADLADAEVAELEGLVLSEFDAAESDEPSNETVERMISLADTLDSVRDEVRRRNELAAALSEKAAAAVQRVRGAEAAAEDEDEDKAEDEDKTEAEAPEELSKMKDEADEAAEDAEAVAEEVEAVADDIETAEADAAVPEDEEEDEEKKQQQQHSFSADTDAAAPENDPRPTTELSAETPATTEHTQEDAVTASSNEGAGVVVTPPASAAPHITTEPRSGVNLTITAGADIPGYGTGSSLDSMESVADAFAKRLHTLRNVQGGDGAQHTVATLAFEFPEDRILSGDDPGNITKVSRVVGPQAITAAGAGICAPLETLYDVNICGDDDRPIRDALGRFNADRGGVRIFGSPTLVGGVGIWERTGTKNCADAACPTPTDVQLDAIYACLKFSNYTNRFFPEVVKANTDLALINHAREAELHLIKKIYALSSQSLDVDALAGAKAAPKVGIVREIILALRSAAAYLRRVHRLKASSPLRVILPNWVSDAMIADLAMQMPGDGLEALEVSESRIAALFRNAGVNVTWALDDWKPDGTPATTPSIAAGGFEGTLSFPIFPEGTFLFLDGGTLDLGVQRDATMLTANEYATFVETFEGLAKIGCESLWVNAKVCVSGATAALVDTSC
jgi:hypothetical protein